MTTIRQRIRHLRSIAGSYKAKWMLARYRKLQKAGDPVVFRLPGQEVKLLPSGHIAELVYTSKFEYIDVIRVLTLLRRGMNVVDVGANVGLYSILSDRVIGAGGVVMAFEPSSECRNMLAANIALNNCSSVRIEGVALSDFEGRLALRRDPGYRDGDRYLDVRKKDNAKRSISEDDQGDSEEVVVTRLDTYLSSNQIFPKVVNFIKIDVEGGELGVLRGARRTLESNHGVILMFECTPQGCECFGHTVEDVVSYLAELGFGVYVWDAEKHSWDCRRDVIARGGNLWAARYVSDLPI